MYGEKKRKSNFDVGPENVAAPSGLTTFLHLQTNGALDGMGVDPMKEVQRLRDQISLTFGDIPGLYVVATDPAFAARIEKALEKNFEYILRKDSQSSEQSKSYAQKAPSSNPLRPQTFSGVGSMGQPYSSSQQTQQIIQHVQESFSVYVSNLPLDITEEEVEILFGSSTVQSQQGKMVKKIKLYTTPSGSKKGDALVTFTRTEYAGTACTKFNGLDIGDGHVIKVVRANFQQYATDGSTTKPPPSSSGSNDGNNTGFVGASSGSGGSFLYSVSMAMNDRYEDGDDGDDDDSGATAKNVTVKGPIVFASSSSSSSSSVGGNHHGTQQLTNDKFHSLLPPESEASLYPVAIIRNVFDSGMDENQANAAFFDDLEAEMLLECVKFGKVRYLTLLEPSFALPEGTCAVTFGSASAAEACAAALNGRKFDQQRLITHVVLPRSHEDVRRSLPSHVPPPPPPPMCARPKHVVLAPPVAAPTTTAAPPSSGASGSTKDSGSGGSSSKSSSSGGATSAQLQAIQSLLSGSGGDVSEEPEGDDEDDFGGIYGPAAGAVSIVSDETASRRQGERRDIVSGGGGGVSADEQQQHEQTAAAIAAAVEDVDDFLNSFL